MYAIVTCPYSCLSKGNQRQRQKGQGTELNLLFVTERQDLFLSEISMAKLPFLLEKGSDELKPHLILKTVVPSTRLDDSGGTLRHWEDPGGLMWRERRDSWRDLTGAAWSSASKPHPCCCLAQPGPAAYVLLCSWTQMAGDRTSRFG